MEKILSGKAFAFGNNVDTDQIYPGRFVELTDVEDIAKHAMEGADTEFVKQVSAGDFIIGGTNFGCGSSREHAAICLKTVGVGAIIAESFARIFYRNAINLGVPLLVCPEILKVVHTGDALHVNLLSGEIRNEMGVIAHIEPLSEYVFHILECGGIKPLIKQQMQA